MKIQLFRVVTLALFLTLLNCNDKAKEAETKEAEDVAVAKVTTEEFKADIAKSVINWEGFKPGGSHYGTINLAEGTVQVKDDEIKSGSFIINMDSIVVTDIPADDDGNADLTGHLKADDFFGVETYPTAKFEITGIETKEGKTMLSGNLTMKNITNNVSIPVSTSVNGNAMTLTSEPFTIDRTKWNIKYKSKSIFGDLGDKFINDDIELKVNITANKS